MSTSLVLKKNQKAAAGDLYAYAFYQDTQNNTKALAKLKVTTLS